MHPHTTCPACQAVRQAGAPFDAWPVPEDAPFDDLVVWFVHNVGRRSWIDNVTLFLKTYKVTKRKP